MGREKGGKCSRKKKGEEGKKEERKREKMGNKG